MANKKEKQAAPMTMTDLDSIAPIDADMPEPETKDYTPTYKLMPTFMVLIENTLGQLPYATILTNRKNDRIKLIDLVKFIEAKQALMTVNELEEVLAFIGNGPFRYVRPLMEMVDNKERHNELWQPC